MLKTLGSRNDYLALMKFAVATGFLYALTRSILFLSTSTPGTTFNYQLTKDTIPVSTNAPSQPASNFQHDSIRTIVIDSTAIAIGKRGLKEEDFINQILTDTAFYEAFHSLKHFSFIADNNIRTFNKKGEQTAHITRSLLHDNSTANYHIRVLSQRDSGEVYKSGGRYRLFTVQMFSYVFENEKNSDFIKDQSPEQKLQEGYKQKLKKLIFRPGTRIDGLPFISDKTEIFSKKLRPYYNYKFSSATYLNAVPVYRFECKVKPQFANDGSVMIKELTTIFDKKNFKILGRFVDMQYENLLFSFDVRMNIEAGYIDDEIVPVLIQYAGNWDVPFKKKEISSFIVRLHDFKKK